MVVKFEFQNTFLVTNRQRKTKGKPTARLELKNTGGDEGDRTPDLCNAIAALSQLSYVPI
jgi:hypothetical protein